MRVVDRKAFLALPAGTMYCKGVQWAFDSLCIKGDSLTNDWIYLDPAWPSAHDTGEAVNFLVDSLEEGESFPCEDAYGRDGCFDEDAVFLIFEHDDLWILRGYIDTAISLSKPQTVIGKDR